MCFKMACRKEAFAETMAKIVDGSKSFIQDKSELKFRLEMAAREMLANALEHGCSSKEEEIKIVLILKPSHIILKVISPGSGFNWRKATLNYMPNLEAEGRGIPMIKIAADKVEFNEAGNIITAEFKKGKLNTLKEVKKIMETKIYEDEARIIPQESINITNAKNLREEFNKVVNKGINKIILDLRNVEDIDSAALGKILVVKSALKEKDGKLIIENVHAERVKKVFDTVNLSEVIEIRD